MLRSVDGIRFCVLPVILFFFFFLFWLLIDTFRACALKSMMDISL